MAVRIRAAARRDRNTIDGYVPPTPSALIRPGTDYQVGVAPFLAAGLALTTVTPNMRIPRTSLTSDSQGNIVVNVAGSTLTALYLPTGYINVTAANVTVDRCLINGYDPLVVDGDTVHTKGLVNATALGATGLLVKDTTCFANYPSGVWDGVRGHDFTARRCEAYSVTDCSGIYNSNSGHTSDPVTVLLEGCNFHDMAYVSPDPNHSGDLPVSHSHNDCCQIQGAAAGSSIEIRYSNLMGFLNSTYGPTVLLDSAHPNTGGGYNVHYPNFQSNSAIQVTQGVAAVTGLNVHDNWMDGGGYTVNVGTSQGAYSNFGSIVNNHLGRNNSAGQAISVPANAAGATLTGNTYIDDGATVAVARP